MRTSVPVVAALTAVVVLGAGPRPLAAQEPSPDEAGVRAVVQAFGDALAAGDSTAALALLHPDLVVYESGHAETLAEYRSGHLAADIEFASAVAFETLDEDLALFPGAALYTSRYTAKGTFRGREIDAHGVETIVLVPTDGGWRIRHIHWSSR